MESREELEKRMAEQVEYYSNWHISQVYEYFTDCYFVIRSNLVRLTNKNLTEQERVVLQHTTDSCCRVLTYTFKDTLEGVEKYGIKIGPLISCGKVGTDCRRTEIRE